MTRGVGDGRRLRRALALALCLAMPACTIAKPIVCTFTWPVLFLSSGFEGKPLFSGDGGNGMQGEAALYLLGLVFAIGPVGGLVTGIISDVNVLTGRSRTGKPAYNIHNPLLTNGKGSR